MESGHRHEGHTIRRAHRGIAVAGRRRSASCGGLVVWSRWYQRAHRDRAGPRARTVDEFGIDGHPGGCDVVRHRQDGRPGGDVGADPRRLARERSGRVVGRRRPHARPPARPHRPRRQCLCAHQNRSRRGSPRAGRAVTGSGSRRTDQAGTWHRRRLLLLGTGCAVGRHGPTPPRRRACFRRGDRRDRAGFRCTGGLFAARHAHLRRRCRRNRPNPAGSRRRAVGTHSTVALTRSRAGCGDRPLHGRGRRRDRLRGTQPRRWSQGHRDPLEADGSAPLRPGRDGAARSRRPHHRGPSTQLRRRVARGLRFTTAKRRSRPARADREGHRRGAGPQPPGATRRGRCRLAPPNRRPDSRRSAVGADRSHTYDAAHPAADHGGPRGRVDRARRRLLGT